MTDTPITDECEWPLKPWMMLTQLEARREVGRRGQCSASVDPRGADPRMSARPSSLRATRQ